MDFGSLLDFAQKNEKNAAGNAYYRARFDPPKKEKKQNSNLSSNIQKFLQQKEEEERKKSKLADDKRRELLAMRDPKDKRKIEKMLKVIKSANKSVLNDIYESETAVTANGPSQPDEDDYGYESQVCADLFQKIMNKYSKMPADEKFPTTGKATIKDLGNTKDRVRAAIERDREIENDPHLRRMKRKEERTSTANPEPSHHESSKSSRHQSVDDSNDYKQPSSHSQKEEKKKRPPAPPPLDFHELLRLAELKRQEPVVLPGRESGRSGREKSEEPVPPRPMTTKERKVWLEEQERLKRRALRDKQDMKRASPARKPTVARNNNSPQPAPSLPNRPKPFSIPKIPKKADAQRPPAQPLKSEQRQAPEKSSKAERSPPNDIERQYEEYMRNKMKSVRSHSNSSSSSNNSNKPNSSEKMRQESRSAPQKDRPRSQESEKSYQKSADDRHNERSRNDRHNMKSSDDDRIRERSRDNSYSSKATNSKSMDDRLKEKSRNDSYSSKVAHSKSSEERSRGNSYPSKTPQSKSSDDRLKERSRDDSYSKTTHSKSSDDRLKERSRDDSYSKTAHSKSSSDRPKERMREESYSSKTTPSDSKSKERSRDDSHSFQTARPKSSNDRLKERSREELYSSKTAQMKSSNDQLKQKSRDEQPNKIIHNKPIMASKDNATKTSLKPNNKPSSRPEERNIPKSTKTVPTSNGISNKYDNLFGKPNISKPELKSVPPKSVQTTKGPQTSRPGQLPQRRPDIPANAKQMVKPSMGNRPNGTAPPPRQFPPPDMRTAKKPVKRRIDSDSEKDSDMDDFIDDDEDAGDYSSYIKEIFGYDKSRYRGMDEDDVDAMESNFAEQMKEEYYSKRIGIMEDLEDMRMEAEEKKRKAKKLKK